MERLDLVAEFGAMIMFSLDCEVEMALAAARFRGEAVPERPNASLRWPKEGDQALLPRPVQAAKRVSAWLDHWIEVFGDMPIAGGGHLDPTLCATLKRPPGHKRRWYI